jgi:hypothetical protein
LPSSATRTPLPRTSTRPTSIEKRGVASCTAAVGIAVVEGLLLPRQSTDTSTARDRSKGH